MKKISKHYRSLQIIYVKVSVLAILVSAFFLPSFIKLENEGNNIFQVSLNGEAVGTVGSMDDIEKYMRKARYEIAKERDDLLLIDTSLQVEGQEVLVGLIDSANKVEDNIKAVLNKNIKETLNRAFTVKINEYTVNLSSAEDVHALLQASIDKYDTTGAYSSELMLDPTRELNVLTTKMITPEVSGNEAVEVFAMAGVEKVLTEMFGAVESTKEKGFEDYQLGLKNLDFGDSVEVVESYLMKDEITPLKEAIDEVTKDQEKEQIYEVVSGDTLSQIAERNNLTIESLIDMNATIDNELSTIRVGDEIIVTVPEPELSVERLEEAYYEEAYEAETQYVDNNSWYTTEQVTRQEPSAGYRKVVVNVSFRNNKEVAREVVKEEVTFEAIPKIIERGTKIPPTYLKPISGGRQSSGFGRRKAPTKGASTYHKGNDWATPVGTAVVASSAGTVAKAGWGSGYGYVVYINHSDGKQTRYGHLSKVLVKPGQFVQQGQKIALSGNTGRSSGPHVHFEILINGSQVNPLKYLN